MSRDRDPHNDGQTVAMVYVNRLNLNRHGSVRWERNCRHYAREWRDRVLATLPEREPGPRERAIQAVLF